MPRLKLFLLLGLSALLVTGLGWLLWPAPVASVTAPDGHVAPAAVSAVPTPSAVADAAPAAAPAPASLPRVELSAEDKAAVLAAIHEAAATDMAALEARLATARREGWPAADIAEMEARLGRMRQTLADLRARHPGA